MNNIFGLIIAYKYIILFPLAFFEGPIISIIAGFLVSAGFMNLLIVYFIIVFADIFGDAMFYSIGYSGKDIINKHGHYLGITKEKMEKANSFFNENHRKAIILSKLVHGIGATGLIAAGSLKIPYWKFFKTCIFISLIQVAFFLTIGIFFGGAYVHISKYLNYYAAIISILAIILVIFIFYKRANIDKFNKEKIKKIKDYE
jgi:membrane protein DedA with SNARE-associated domain